MKKTLIATILLLISNNIINAQKNFEGVVVYDMVFDKNSGLPPEAAAMLKGSTITTYIKDDKRRTDTNTPMSTQSIIIDEKAKTVVSLMDIMGQKYLIRMNPEDGKEQFSTPEIKYIEETKTVAGYKCKKAEITVKSKEGKEDKINIFYTDEIIDSDIRPAYKGLKGFPMEYVINQNGMKITLTAKNVTKEKVPENKFDIPKDYKETTLEEMQKGLMKMGQ
ncbi:MAG: DUF4412 domain-containing protein [Bacteroidota bacterium]